MFDVYVLLDISTGHRYVGQTNRLEKRLHEHLSHQSPYTSLRGPYTLILVESFTTRRDAIRRENYFKSGVGREYLNQILDD